MDAITITVTLEMSIPADPPERGEAKTIARVDRGYGSNPLVRYSTVTIINSPDIVMLFPYEVRRDGKPGQRYATYSEAIDAAIRCATELAKEIGYSVALRQERRERG